jgi:hypothetical protein
MSARACRAARALVAVAHLCVDELIVAYVNPRVEHEQVDALAVVIARVVLVERQVILVDPVDPPRPPVGERGVEPRDLVVLDDPAEALDVHHVLV